MKIKKNIVLPIVKLVIVNGVLMIVGNAQTGMLQVTEKFLNMKRKGERENHEMPKMWL